MAPNSLLRFRLLALAVSAICLSAAACLAAQTTSTQASDAPNPHEGRHGGHALNRLIRSVLGRPGPEKSAGEPSTAPAVFDATKIGSPVQLDKGWRVGITANPAAAAPEFDDSDWAVRDASASLADVSEDEDDEDGPVRNHGQNQDQKKPDGKKGSHFHIQYDGGGGAKLAWFRLHIKLAPGHGPLALLIELPVPRIASLNSNPEDTAVFVNGVEARPDGPIHAEPERYTAITHLYYLNVDPDAEDLTLAVRTAYIPFGARSYTSFFAGHTLSLGHPDDLNKSVELWSNRTLFERLPNLVNGIELTVLSLFLLALYFTQPGHREYLWLSLFELVLAPVNFLDLASRTSHMETLLYGALSFEMGAAAAYLYFEFLTDILNLRQRWAGKLKRWILYFLRWTAPIVACTGPCMFLPSHSTLFALLLGATFLFAFLWFSVWLLFSFSVLIAATVRRNFEAGMLLIPLVLSLIGTLEAVVGVSISSVTGHPYDSPLTFRAGPIPIYFSTVASFVGTIAIVLIIFVRFQRIHRDRERAASELAAARSVQELMIPNEKIKTPGFEVDSVYTPANEVGGDFFHIESTADGGLLVVVGDVAGHGLKAAMSVSMIIGALRRSTERSPAKILESLNRVLVGSESFTTCQAAWFSAAGELVISSAGHLSPYINSQEISLPGGLPLGVVSGVSYDETRLYLHPGDRILFLSDGVVEARHSNGELFGFQRVHNLSNQSAFYIADAAKAFGQEDDITVLTVRRLADAAAAA
jgi:hypothetical protein